MHSPTHAICQTELHSVELCLSNFDNAVTIRNPLVGKSGVEGYRAPELIVGMGRSTVASVEMD